MLRQLFKKIFSPEKKFQDGFIARIRVAVAGEGMMTDGNIFAFEHAIQNLPQEGSLLEIGSFGGMSTNILAWLLRKHGQQNRPFFTCDPWFYEGFHDHERRDDPHYMALVDGHSELSRLAYMEFVRESFLHSVSFFSAENLPHSFRLTSDEFFEKWQNLETATDLFNRETQLGGPLAFCYVDGNHAYDFARRDVDNVLKNLLPGGFVLLDDSAVELPFGSAKLAQELLVDKRLKLVMKNPNYLFQR